MPPLASLSLVTESPPADGVHATLAAALAPLWPALLPWLSVLLVALVMGVATEVVARELRRTVPAPGRPPGDPRRADRRG